MQTKIIASVALLAGSFMIGSADRFYAPVQD